MLRPLPAIHFFAIAALVSLLAGCATPPPTSDPEALAEYRATNDPAEPFNRAMFDVHQAIDSAILRPINIAYRWLPSPVRAGWHHPPSRFTSRARRRSLSPASTKR